MKMINIEDVLHNTPFKPFTVELDNGQSIKVPHPDFMIMNKSKTTAVIVDGDHFRIIDCEHITAISVKAKG